MNTGNSARERAAYPLWDIKLPQIPSRARLFRLEPIGVGTSEVESLTSYVARLAAEHCTSPRRLLLTEILASAGKNTVYYSSRTHFSASQINSIQGIAATVATGLEHLTMRHDLRYMTLLRWSAVLSPNQLLRSTKAWCAICYGERLREGEVIYEPLIWAFEIITICPKHYVRLCQACPKCMRQIPYLSRDDLPGYCSRCQAWLGSADKAGSGPKAIGPAESAHQARIIYSVGELLSRSPSIPFTPQPHNFIGNLAYLIAKDAGHNINFFADLVGIWSGAIRRLLAWKTRLRVEVLCKLCSSLNVSPLDLLLNRGNDSVFRERHLLLHRDVPVPNEVVPWEEIEGRLRLALVENPPPSMEAVARRMGYHPPKVKRHYPELCGRIIERYWEHQKSKHPPPEEIKRALRDALKEQPPPSLQRVFRRLGCKDTGYYYYTNYIDLCFAVARRYRAYRNKPFDKGREQRRLRAALQEEPPPSFSEIARRLGHNREFVRKKFPVLSKAITSRYVHHTKVLRREKAERLHHAISDAVKQLVASGLNASERRVKKLVKQHLPSPGRDILFKQALREAKAELGLA